jgi:GT2 family glycosyltransferase
VRLSACIVSYRSAEFALACARSVTLEWQRAGGAPAGLDLVVVDNPAPALEDHAARREQAALDELEEQGALVVRSDCNRGYAGGVELGLGLARRADWQLVLNADVVLLPGSLAAMLAAAEGEHAGGGLPGAVGPQAFVDAGGTLAHPPLADTTPLREWGRALAEVCPDVARRAAERRTRAALACWEARAPYEAEALAGACLLIPERARRALGGVLLDPRYPLYFEDGDLARRLRALELASVVVPAARVAHHWARSSGVGADFEDGPAQRHAESRRRFLERWHPGAGVRLTAAADELVAGWSGPRGTALHAFLDLGRVERAPVLELSRPAGPRGFVLEVAMTPHLALAAGVLGCGSRAALSPEAFDWLFPGRLYLRALDREDLRCLGAWTLVKTAAARTRPVAPDELAGQVESAGAMGAVA